MKLDPETIAALQEASRQAEALSRQTAGIVAKASGRMRVALALNDDDLRVLDEASRQLNAVSRTLERIAGSIVLPDPATLRFPIYNPSLLGPDVTAEIMSHYAGELVAAIAKQRHEIIRAAIVRKIGEDWTTESIESRLTSEAQAGGAGTTVYLDKMPLLLIFPTTTTGASGKIEANTPYTLLS